MNEFSCKPIIKISSSEKINTMGTDSLHPLEIILENDTEQEIPSPPVSKEIQNIELLDNTQYIISIKYYFLYLMYGFLGGLLFNCITLKNYNGSIVNFDMIFNCIISPILYYHSPKHILTKMERKDWLYFYTPFYIVGLCFRFLDTIPEINNFTLNLINIDSTIKIILATFILIVFLGICGYYIFKSRFPKINSIMFFSYLIFTISSFYYFYYIGGTIYFHHYFVGLLVMIISRNVHSKIVIIIHAIGYGVYIDGISRWGFASIYFR